MIRELWLKDIPYTRTDWINLGRDTSNLEICQYEDGDEKYMSVVGVPYKNPIWRAGCYIRMVQEYPIYLLEPSNRVIGDVLGKAFEPVAPPSAHISLSWIRELQRMEISLQNKLNQDPDVVHTGLVQVMQTKMIDNSSFVKARNPYPSLSLYGRRHFVAAIPSS